MFSSNNQDFVWLELPPAGSKNRQCTSDRKFYGHKPYYAEKYCDKRFLDRVINLIPDSGSKALWSLIPFFWALSPFLWALIPIKFWALIPEPIYHVTTLEYAYIRAPKIMRKALQTVNEISYLTRCSVFSQLIFLAKFFSSFWEKSPPWQLCL